MICARLGDFTATKTFSRCIASISGPFVSTMSTVLRLLRASVTARCSTFSLPARQVVVFRPYFFSKPAISAPMSSLCADV